MCESVFNGYRPCTRATKHYKLRQPERLQHWANTTLARWFVAQAEKMIHSLSQHDVAGAAAALSEQITLIRRYLDHNMPKCKLLNDTMAQKAMDEITKLNCYSYFDKSISGKNKLLIDKDIDVVGRMIETLFSDKLIKLQILDSRLTTFRTTFCLKSYMFTGLVHLKFHFPMWLAEERDALETDIINMIKELHNLKYLVICNDWSDNILSCIASNCPLVEELDVSYSEDAVTDHSMDIISKLRNLRILKIRSTEKVSEKGLQMFLLTCKQIEHISIRNGSQDISKALCGIASDETNSAKTFQLKTYLSQNDTVQQLATIIRMCPLIQHLTIDLEDELIEPNTLSQPAHNHWETNLSAVTGLDNLKELELRYGSFYGHKVGEMLQSFGRNLTRLNFEFVDEMNVNTLIHINQTCPNLQSVKFNNCEFNEDITLSGNELNIPTFRNLRNIHLDWFYNTGLKTIEYLNDDIACNISSILFSNCLDVETIHISRGVLLTEQIMSRIMDKNPLRNLKLLEIGDYKSKYEAITAPILHRIVQNCVGFPCIIENVTIKRGLRSTPA